MAAPVTLPRILEQVWSHASPGRRRAHRTTPADLAPPPRRRASCSQTFGHVAANATAPILTPPADVFADPQSSASTSRRSGEWSDDGYDVLADGVVVGRIVKAAAKPADASWLWTLAYGYHEDRTPTHSYEPTREAAMAAFAKSWRRE